MCAQFCELLLRLAVAMVNAADFDREFTAARPHPPKAPSAHPAATRYRIAPRLACLQRAYAVQHGCARVPATCD